MAHTLVDPPPTPTLMDLEAPTTGVGPPEQRPPPAPRRGPWLALLLGGIGLALVLGVGALVYLFVWRYEPTARRHIPANTNVVVRFEASDILLFGPVRKHLWPLLDEPSPPPAAPAGAPAAKSRVDRIKAETGVNLQQDLRELIVASVDANSWVLLAGGRITKDRFVKGLEKVLREEGTKGWAITGELLVGPGGVAIGQADDGTLVIGTDVAIVTAALPISEEYKRLRLPERGAVTFAITKQAWSGAAGKLVQSLPRGSVLTKIERASGSMVLGSSPEVEMRLEAAPGTPAASLASDVEVVLGDLRLIMLLLPDVAGEKQALQNLKVTSSGSEVVLKTPWPHEGLDRGCAALSRLLRGVAPAPTPTITIPGLPGGFKLPF